MVWNVRHRKSKYGTPEPAIVFLKEEKPLVGRIDAPCHRLKALDATGYSGRDRPMMGHSRLGVCAWLGPIAWNPVNSLKDRCLKNRLECIAP